LSLQFYNDKEVITHLQTVAYQGDRERFFFWGGVVVVETPTPHHQTKKSVVLTKLSQIPSSMEKTSITT
jgi:hypothetical protein